MRASEYIERATAYIADPARVLEVRRELEEHLKEASTEVEAMGIEPETAELVAVARMGPPEKVALDLAEAHHRHLPWRHYLAIVPAMVLALSYPADHRFVSEAAPFWWIVLVICLSPGWSTIARWSTILRLDAYAKIRWVLRQPRRMPLVVGLCTGGLTGLLFALGVALGGPGGLLTVLFMLVAPAAVTVGGLLLFRPQVPALHAGVVAAPVFAAICTFSAFADGGILGATVGLTISGGYAMVIIGAAWLIDRMADRAKLVRT